MHLDCVALLKRMVKDPWRIDNLPPEIAVVNVPDIK